MRIFELLANFYFWLLDHLSVTIGGYTFNLLGAVIIAGIFAIFFSIINKILGD